MSKLANGLTPRQERFCQFFAEDPNGTRAARYARYGGMDAANRASRLLRQPRIQARIAEIQAELAREACLSTEVFLGKLEIVFRRALDCRNFAAASRAIDLQSRIVARHAVSAGQALDSETKSEKKPIKADESPRFFFKTVNIPCKSKDLPNIRKAE